MKKLLAFLSFILLTGLVASQEEMKITGTVYDTSGVQPIHKALAMAVRVKDSVLLGFTRTDENGYFDLKGVPVDTFSLIITSKGFDDKSYYIFGHSGNKEINIPRVVMPEKSQDLDEVIIYANKNPIFYNGDTLVYVADSFKTGENAVVEDLLKKLPGLEVDEDGNIVSQGKEINKVLVDGDEFFGPDPTIATKNLGADGVETVQVYEKQDESAGASSDEKIQVLDLKLKENAKKGYFGRISGATDFGYTQRTNSDILTSTFYEGELLVNKFNGSQKISVFALGSNTPRSNFSRGDMYKFGLDNEGGRGPNDDGFKIQTGNEPVGIPQTFRAGVYYTDKFGKNKQHKLGFNYSYYDTRLNSYSASRSQFILEDTTYFTDDSTADLTSNMRQNINFNYEWKIDSLSTLKIEPKITLNEANADNTDMTSFLSSNNSLQRTTNINNTTASEGFDLNNEIRYTRKFKKPKRELSLRHYLVNRTDDSKGVLTFDNRYENIPSLNDTTDQQKTIDQDAVTNIGVLSYTEPLGKRFKLENSYYYENGFIKQDKETKDKLNGEYTELVQGLSNNFDNSRQQHRLSTYLIYEKSKHTIGLGLAGRNILIDNHNLVTDTIIKQNVSNLLPKATYIYRPSRASRLSVRYTTRSEQPSINDLQPIPDNTNPNQIQIGNADLLPNYVHQGSIFFNTWKALTGRYVWAGANGNYTVNGFGDSTSFDGFGRAVSQTVNVDGNYFAILFAGAGIPVWKKKLTFQPQITSSSFRNTSYINGQENTTTNNMVQGTLGLKFQFDSLEFDINGQYAFNDPRSTLSTGLNQPYTTQNYKGEVRWTLPQHFKVKVEADYNVNDGRAAGFGVNYLLVNAEISKNFLKTENLNVAIVGNDILNQNISATRSVSANIITDYRTRIISRYFLLKATLRFNNRKTTEKDMHGWF